MKKFYWLLALGLGTSAQAHANDYAQTQGYGYIADYGMGFGTIESPTRSLQFSAPKAAPQEYALLANPFDDSLNLPENGYDDGVDEAPIPMYSQGDRSAPLLAATTASRAAGSRTRSLGKCAMYVRKALQAAGYKFTPKPSAYMYAYGTLQNAGFSKIPNGTPPRAGDVVVWSRSAKNPHGHIQIFDGKDWVSDFRQARFNPYRDAREYTTWRDSRYLGDTQNGMQLAFNN